jgi:hypothetical protein
MISRATATAALLCVAISAAACGPAFQQDEDGAPTPRSESTLKVDNHNWSDMRIYLVRDGITTRLGFVSSMTERSINLPASALSLGGEVRLMAAPLGSTERFFSDPLHLAPGQMIEWRLENRLPLSSIWVW